MSESSDVPNVAPADALAAQQNGEALIVDVREPAEFTAERTPRLPTFQMNPATGWPF